MVDGTVAFVVSLRLTKWGDAEGRQLDCRYDIVPSLVHLQPFIKTEKTNNKLDPEVTIPGAVLSRLSQKTKLRTRNLGL
jgi:hypothetical protein